VSWFKTLITEYTVPFMTQEHILIRNSIREFAEKEVRPLAKKVDVEEYYPREMLYRLGEQGVLGVRVPEEYGGSPVDSISMAIIMEELSKASGSIALVAGVQSGLAVNPIVGYGTEEQKKKYLPRLASGEIIGAFGLTEPCCGSDAAALEMKAEKDGDGYTLSGRKTFITNGLYADVIVTFARTGTKEERHRGITAFIVERSSCIEASPLHPMGFRGTGTAELRYDNCYVPPDNILGKVGEGFKIAMYTLDEGRIGASAVAIGLAAAALEEAYEWTLNRQAFGRPIHKFQAVRFQIVDMAVQLEAMRLLTYTAAYLKDKGDPRYIWMASAAKLFSGIAANKLVGDAVRILGGLGYVNESNVERIYRDVKLLEIGEGTNEVQRWIMGKILYGELF